MAQDIPKGQKLEQRVHRQYLLREAEQFREHRKGIPEWLKNADDSYVRHEDTENVDYSKLPIILNFGKNEVMCLDFGGAEGKDIIENLPYYGSPDAATQGKKLKREVSGGHGNGGKFYGLAQFEECQVIDYYEGKLTMLTLKKDGDYVNFNDKNVDPGFVIDLLGIYGWSYFDWQRQIYQAIQNLKLNLFCWRGIRPKDKINGKRDVSKILQSVSKNPQARSALNSRIVDVLIDGRLYLNELKPPKLEPDSTKTEREFVLPNKIDKYDFNKKATSILKVIFYKYALTGEDESLNILEIFANGKPIAYYSLPSLLIDKGIAKYMYASIDCPELKEDYNAVNNDRTKLVENDAANKFLSWCSDRLKEVLIDETNKEMRSEEDKNLEVVSAFVNEVIKDLIDLLEEETLLPTYAEKGDKLAEVLAPTDEIGGYGSTGKIKELGGGKRRGKLKQKVDNAIEKPKKSILRILISNKDDDPLHKGQKFDMIERQPILYQRPEDVPYGIWWINSQKEYVRKLKVDQPAGKAFFCFLVKEIVLSNTYRKRYQDTADIDPDSFDELDFDLIDKVFSKVTRRLSIDITEENLNERIRESIRNKERFTISELSKELGIESSRISVFVNDPRNGIDNTFTITKGENPSGKGPQVNIYIKKTTK
ncbi:MAG: hypothetical protein ACP5U0_08115 [Caldisphaera sp.]